MWIIIIVIIIFLVYCANNKNYNPKGPEEIEKEQAQAQQKKLQAEAKAKEDADGKLRLKQYAEAYASARNALISTYQNIPHIIRHFFSSNVISASNTVQELANALNALTSWLSRMKENNKLLILNTGYKSEIRAKEITDATDLIAQAESLISDFKTYLTSAKPLADPTESEMVATYGNTRLTYQEAVKGMERTDAVSYIAACKQCLLHGQLNEIYAIDIKKVLMHIWFFATEKNYSASDFERATDVFNAIYKANYVENAVVYKAGAHVDVVLADYYAKKQMGGEDALRDPVREFLKQSHSNKFLTTIASGLMWMNAYQQEHVVLQHMLASGMEMIPKAQERLRALASSGGKAPESFSVESSDASLYFDVSALTWRDAEYTGFFDNLAFQDKALTYSLAIRDEDKELSIAQGTAVPGTDTQLAKLKEYLAEEFGSTVTARAVRGVALSGNGEEEMDGIVAVSEECRQLGVFITVTRIGRKLSIKFYTLFIPHERDLRKQEQQAVSMSKKLSPKVNVWENGLKDAMLMAVQQLLNSDMPVIPTGKSEEPVGPASGPVYF